MISTSWPFRSSVFSTNRTPVSLRFMGATAKFGPKPKTPFRHSIFTELRNGRRIELRRLIGAGAGLLSSAICVAQEWEQWGAESYQKDVKRVNWPLLALRVPLSPLVGHTNIR